MDKQLRKGTAVLVAAVSVLALAGCSDDTPSACDSAKDLQASVDALFSSETLDGGRDSIESAVDDVQADLGQLKESAADDFGPQLDDLETQVDDVGSSIKDLELGDLDEGLQQVGDQIEETGDAWNALVDEVKSSADDCDLDATSDTTPEATTTTAG